MSMFSVKKICPYIGWLKMIVDKYGNYVRKFMWQVCGSGRVDICMTFHKRAFDLFYTIDYELSKKCQLYPTHTVAT
jgi:hypothetical protein